MNTYTISKKLLVIGLLAVVCLVASTLVMGLVSEREQRYTEVQNEVGNTWGLPQTILGPVLVFEKLAEWNGTEYTYVLPTKLNIETVLEPEVRSRGIFDTIVYTEKVKIQGTFSSDDFPSTQHRNLPKLVVSLGDTRCIEKQIQISWNSIDMPFSPGTSADFFGEVGIHANVPLLPKVQEYPFSFELTLRGNKTAHFVPVGKETVVTTTSSWQYPEFVGAYLPTDRTVNTEGFSATWNISSFSRSYPQVWRSGDAVSMDTLTSSQFGIDLNQGVSLYTQVLRSVKYAVLFILITFTTFFLFETLNKIRIHPIQYLLIGSSLALFYLLLLSLTEQIGFLFAYILATAMTTLLITLYSVSVLKQKNRSVIIFFLLSTLYSYLYFVLKLEEYALLFGSLLVFVLLALVMYLTRNIDWYTYTQE